MSGNVIIEILKNPNENGIAVFVLGLLFILSIYHFLLYFQHKDKVYLYYSLYTFLIFISHLNDPKNGFISTLVKPIASTLGDIDTQLIWSYNMLYFIFAYSFLDLKSFSVKWYKFIFYSIYVLFFLSILHELSYRITGNYEIIYNGHYYFVIYLSILGVISYIPLFQMNNPLKYYIIIGSTFLFGSSIVATIINIYDILPVENELRYSIFYLGVIFENILFSLGLGHKQKIILNEKNHSQELLIKQLQENESLREKINTKLKKNVATLSKKAETEKMDSLKAKYDKELAELKVTSLRSQMNPHFIFNSLNAIKLYIINNEQKNAVYYLNKFSKLIRRILSGTREKETTLNDEIETIELYIDIENIRFSNEIIYTKSIDDHINTQTIKLPSLILQPFIENSLWHGLSPKDGEKKLHIDIRSYKTSHVSISIIDNGIGRTRAKEIKQDKVHKKDSYGITLTKERLNHFSKGYQHDYSLTFVDLYDDYNNAIGTKVVIQIPIE